MLVVAGLFRDRDRAMLAADRLRAAGFDGDAVMVIGSPTSAGEVASQAARELARPPGGMLDLGAIIGGQAASEFPDEERSLYEERVAQGDTLLSVQAADRAAMGRAEAILREAGAERVTPGLIRD